MSRQRRNFSAKFKSDLVIELLKGEKDLNTLAVENNIQPNLLRNWKKEFLDNASAVFDDKREDNLKEKLAEERKEKAEYDSLNGEYLYNRCHLIGFQLAGENANEKNLITGTRYMNVEGMLPFENEVADYIRKTGNHVLYRVTPIYEGINPVASGVEMEAASVEDDGWGVRFHVCVYNVQPGIENDYRTGKSREAESLKENKAAERLKQNIQAQLGMK